MKDLAPFPPIYVISLPRSRERRQGIQRRLDTLGRAYEIVDAVDGATVDWSQHTPRLRRNKYMIFFDRDLAAGEIGCYLSHYGLWERMVAEQTECALILEDDACWDDDFAEIVMQVMTAPWYWEVVALSRSRRAPLDCVLCPLGNNRRLVRYLSRGMSTVAYLVRLEGAKKLCAYCRDMTHPVDWLYERWWRNGVAFYRVDPPPTSWTWVESVILYDEQLSRRDKEYCNRPLASPPSLAKRLKIQAVQAVNIGIQYVIAIKVFRMGLDKWKYMAVSRYARSHPPRRCGVDKGAV